MRTKRETIGVLFQRIGVLALQNYVYACGGKYRRWYTHYD
jgi:hypothetical protein